MFAWSPCPLQKALCAEFLDQAYAYCSHCSSSNTLHTSCWAKQCMKSFTVVLIKTTRRRGFQFISVDSNDGRQLYQLLLAYPCFCCFSSKCLVCCANLKEIDDEVKEGNDGEHEGEDGLGCRAAVAALYCAAAATSL